MRVWLLMILLTLITHPALSHAGIENLPQYLEIDVISPIELKNAILQWSCSHNTDINEDNKAKSIAECQLRDIYSQNFASGTYKTYEDGSYYSELWIPFNSLQSKQIKAILKTTQQSYLQTPNHTLTLRTLSQVSCKKGICRMTHVKPIRLVQLQAVYGSAEAKNLVEQIENLPTTVITTGEKNFTRRISLSDGKANVHCRRHSNPHNKTFDNRSGACAIHIAGTHKVIKIRALQGNHYFPIEMSQALHVQLHGELKPAPGETIDHWSMVDVPETPVNFKLVCMEQKVPDKGIDTTDCMLQMELR